LTSEGTKNTAKWGHDHEAAMAWNASMETSHSVNEYANNGMASPEMIHLL
jgi:hypothetical protein